LYTLFGVKEGHLPIPEEGHVRTEDIAVEVVCKPAEHAPQSLLSNDRAKQFDQSVAQGHVSWLTTARFLVGQALEVVDGEARCDRCHDPI
jgi:hypothetical protein